MCIGWMLSLLTYLRSHKSFYWHNTKNLICTTNDNLTLRVLYVQIWKTCPADNFCFVFFFFFLYTSMYSNLFHFYSREWAKDGSGCWYEKSSTSKACCSSEWTGSGCACWFKLAQILHILATSSLECCIRRKFASE